MPDFNEDDLPTTTAPTADAMTRIVDDMAGTPTSKNVLMGTFARDITVTKADATVVAHATSGEPRLILNTPAGSKFAMLRAATAKWRLWNYVTARAAIEVDEATDAVSFGGPVTLPVPTAVGHGVRVVAWDAATGRYAVQGPAGVVEQGDTGWRDITAMAGVTAPVGATTFALFVRRTHDLVEWACRVSGTTSPGQQTLKGSPPSGFGAAYSNTCRYGVSSWQTQDAYFQHLGTVGPYVTCPTTGHYRFNFQHSTTVAWPTSLPGIAGNPS